MAEAIGTVLAIIFVLGAATALLVAAVCVRGYVLATLWGWFAVPIFHLPALSIPQAIAASLLIGFLTHQYVPSKDSDKWQPFAASLLGPMFALCFGWTLKTYFF